MDCQLFSHFLDFFDANFHIFWRFFRVFFTFLRKCAGEEVDSWLCQRANQLPAIDGILPASQIRPAPRARLWSEPLRRLLHRGLWARQRGRTGRPGRSCPSAGDSGMRDAECCSTSRKKWEESVTLNQKKVTKSNKMEAVIRIFWITAGGSNFSYSDL